MRRYRVKIFFNDGKEIAVDCDNLIVNDNSHYVIVKDGAHIMTMPFRSVKYTVLITNED